MQRLTTSSLIVLALAASMQISQVMAEDWPQFRGPNCAGISRSKSPLPVKFSAEQNVKWSVDLGDGIGCPVVAAGRVFNSAMVDDKTVGLYAHDAKTGKELWKRTWPAGDIPNIHKTNSQAATTAAADADRVYFYFSTLGLLALDAKTGEDVWRVKDLPVAVFRLQMGSRHVADCFTKDLVIFVSRRRSLSGAVRHRQSATARLRWKDERNDMAVNYSHPGRLQNAPTGATKSSLPERALLIGYDPEYRQAAVEGQDAAAEHQNYARCGRRRRHLHLAAKRRHCQSMVGHGRPSRKPATTTAN